MVDNVTVAIVESGLVLGLDNQAPSTHRWGTCTKHVGNQTAGIMCHKIGPRCLAKACGGRWNVQDLQDEAGDEDGRRYLRREHIVL